MHRVAQLIHGQFVTGDDRDVKTGFDRLKGWWSGVASIVIILSPPTGQMR